MFYKLVSDIVVEPLKKTLSRVISDFQTGFVNGRLISDSTRLVCDTLHDSEYKKIMWLLMLIDFEKAFDSLFWKLLYNTI